MMTLASSSVSKISPPKSIITMPSRGLPHQVRARIVWGGNASLPFSKVKHTLVYRALPGICENRLRWISVRSKDQVRDFVAPHFPTQTDRFEVSRKARLISVSQDRAETHDDKPYDDSCDNVRPRYFSTTSLFDWTNSPAASL